MRDTETSGASAVTVDMSIRPAMTLRDYFAAKAMQGFAADSAASWCDGAAGIARCAYEWADAMLAERNK